ncbi:MAG: putative selenate reductase subunit YgfK, partial [Bacteroidetes bacterium HGW-Bacteroidetes-22]
MTDQFVPIPFSRLVSLSLSQIRKGEFLGIPEEKFYRPGDGKLSTVRFGKLIDTPLGVAAGPHSQLAQNIVAAWLCGARYIELKTIQTLDQLTVSKPCIDMQDEGYNCEWSQELRLEESFSQYLDAWILIHILHHELGFQGAASDTMVFNMSVGYNLEGILKPNVQKFFTRMADCHELMAQKLKQVKDIYPQIHQLSIPDCISDNVTLSTMHGCPPDEIEKIGLYLIREKRLHTVVKLNPTLLGSSEVRSILNGKSGFKTPVPDEAFEHDLKYTDALVIINSLQEAAAGVGVCFGLKLTNTLESLNFKTTFSSLEKQMYMSGRALHPIAVNLAAKLRSVFGEGLDISFSAGVDAFNVSDVLAARLCPVTVCSDLLKPGGYARLHQYIENITSRINDSGYSTMRGFMDSQPDDTLALYADAVVNSTYYRKSFREPSIKTALTLMPFDCIHAPCVNACPTNQDIPGYLYHASQGDFERAFGVILRTNPFPGVTGSVCDHECQTRCTRINYDNPLAIREVKRYIASKFRKEGFPEILPAGGMPKVAVIGAGPSGLSCAWYLRQAGFCVTVYEAGAKAGGMVSSVIPDFRIDEQTLQGDLDRIVSSGVEIKYNQRVDKRLL